MQGLRNSDHMFQASDASVADGGRWCSTAVQPNVVVQSGGVVLHHRAARHRWCTSQAPKRVCMHGLGRASTSMRASSYGRLASHRSLLHARQIPRAPGCQRTIS